MIRNFLGHEIQWLWVMRKLNTPFSVSSYPIGTAKGKDFFGYPVALSSTWYDRGDIYFDEEEIAVIKDFIRFRIRNDSAYPTEIARKVFALADMIKARKIGRDEIEGKTLDDLIALFRRERDPFLQMIGFMSYRGAVQMGDVLAEEARSIVSFRSGLVGKIDELNTYVEHMSAALFPSVVVEERTSLLTHAIGFDALSDVEQDARAKQYLRKFEWLSFHWLVGIPPTLDEVKQRMRVATADAQKELDSIAAQRTEQERYIETLITELDLNEAEKEIIRQYRTWIFLRTFVKDHINLAGYRLLPILHAIADCIGLEREHMPFLTLDEIDRITELSVVDLRDAIASRLDGFSAGMIEGRYTTEGFIKPASLEAAQQIESVTVRGSIAHRGVVQGTAKVILFPKDQDRLSEGEILVTSMTTPDFLPAMRRAAAFVTDEGGITCHAAIVAREMSKPCVIGTKVATQVLHDGDEVEVDAQHGIVRVLNRVGRKNA